MSNKSFIEQELERERAIRKLDTVREMAKKALGILPPSSVSAARYITRHSYTNFANEVRSRKRRAAIEEALTRKRYGLQEAFLDVTVTADDVLEGKTYW